MNGWKKSWRPAALTSSAFPAKQEAAGETAKVNKRQSDTATVTTGDDPIRLRAHDLTDLSVVGTMVQDALIPPGDMRFLKDSGQFVLLLNRFRWETSDGGPPYQRTHAGLRFDNVVSVQFKGIDWDQPDGMMSLLTIAYDPAAVEEGEIVVIHFAGGGAVRLTISSLSCGLEDVGDIWPTNWKPGHEPD